MAFHPDAVVVGAGLAGLVATHELAKAGRRVLLIEQENRNNLGGQAFWSLGGLFFVDSPEQRRVRIKDSLDLARQDWFGSAAFDRLEDEDLWGRQWAEAYLAWAAGGKREYLRELGHRVLPMVGWAERGDGSATGHGNSVPRFHITWGTGPGVVDAFAEPVLAAEKSGLVQLAFRHQVDELLVEGGVVVGVRGSVLAPDDAERGVKSSREVVDTFEHRVPAVVVTSGGIGHNHDLMRANWPTDRVGPAPEHLISGVPAHVDGRMLGITEAAGGRIVNRDRMWAYTEGIHNWDPIWPDHAIRILPGPSSMWFDANGRRLTGMSGVPGADSIGAMTQILATGHDYSWFVLTQSIIEKEFALSGSEQNPDLTGRDVKFLLQSRLAKGAPGPVAAFMEHGEDFVVADTLPELVAGMNGIARGPQLDLEELERQHPLGREPEPSTQDGTPGR
jgi:predicted oxidoreductase